MSWISHTAKKLVSNFAYRMMGEVELQDYIPKTESGVQHGRCPEYSVKYLLATKLLESTSPEVAQTFLDYTFVRFCITPENHNPVLFIESKGGPRQALESSVNEPLLSTLRNMGSESDVQKRTMVGDNFTIIVSGDTAKRIFEDAGVAHTLRWAAEAARADLNIKDGRNGP